MKRPYEDDDLEDDADLFGDAESEEPEQEPELVNIDSDVLHQLGSDDFYKLCDRWRRDPVPDVDPNESIILQQIEVDQSMQQTLREFPMGSETRAPVIRMFGCTRDGNSCVVHVHGFRGYFHIKLPPNFPFVYADSMRDVLNTKLRASMKEPPVVPIVSIQLVQKQSVYYYNFNRLDPFFKIVVASPQVTKEAARMLEDGIDLGGVRYNFALFESKLSHELRFMVDTEIVGCSWVELRGAKWRRRPWHSASGDVEMVSNTQAEFDVEYTDVIAHKPEGEFMDVAPLRVLSFDIECAGRPGVFPEPEIDPVIQIANVVTLQGSTEPLVKNCFCLNTVAPIAGSQVLSFDKEADLLHAWRNFLMAIDPDILTGFNIVRFDMPYLLKRADVLNVKYFPFWTRIRRIPTRAKEKVMTTKQTGSRATMQINIEGRVQLDMFAVIQRDYKLPSYSLNAVSAHFLKEQKEDVHHSIITDLQNRDAESRRRLAVYCIKDALLPIRLMVKLMVVVNYVEMARVTGIPLSFLITRGQGIRVMSQLYRRTGERNFLIPTAKKSADGEKFQGATVLEPIRGFYTDPVSVMDFASLYPTIMRAHNLCYSTLIRLEDVHKVPEDQRTLTPNGDWFAQDVALPGMLPAILAELTIKRKAAKKMMAQEKDPFKRAVYDGRQLALKVSMNSVYGFTGAQVGDLPCLNISSSVTSFGREMIEQTKNYCEEHYNRRNGYEHDAVAVYGDTDSVFVKFGYSDLATAVRLGQEAASAVTQHCFKPPIDLEYEKVYLPLLLMNKKRYAGLLHTTAEKWDYLDSKGLETVRRDNAQITKDVLQTALNRIIIDSDVPGAIAYVKQRIGDLLRGELDISMLVITKGLTKTADQYAGNKLAHVELAAKMKERDAGSAPSVGDRVPYVMIKGNKKSKAYELAEDPLFALENGVPIDYNWYVEHGLREPLTRIFAPIISDVSQLFAGDHTRSVVKSTSMTGALMRWTKISLQCLGCRAAIPDGSGALCKNCQPDAAYHAWRKADQVKKVEAEFALRWTQCQRCHGTNLRDILCSNNSCPQFYARRRVEKDVERARGELRRFDDLSW